MATIYHDSDADLSALCNETVAVVGSLFEKIRAVRDELPFTKWESAARKAFRIGDASE